MALAAHTIEPALDVPHQCSPRIRIKNRVVGTIIARQLQYPHYPCMKYRVRMLDKGTIDFVSAPVTEQSDCLDIGQQVTLDILPCDVVLSPPRWISHLEDNRWPARVVLAAQREFESLVVVKILGRSWTLTSTRRPFWLKRPPRAWDRVTVHVPLDAISVKRTYPGHPHLRPRLLRQVTNWNDGNLTQDDTDESGVAVPVQFMSRDQR